MRAYVFTDTSLARHAGQFVWLEIDNENPANAIFRRRFPTPGLPTFFVIDPGQQTVQLRWLGSLTVGQLHALLDDAHDRRGTPAALLLPEARADSLFGAGDYRAAAQAYDTLLALAPADWRGAARVSESEMFALTQTGQDARAIAFARRRVPVLGRSSSALALAAGALDAAGDLPDSLPERAIPMLEQSERDFPRDYNPPARLAIAYRALHRWRDALAASDRAMALVEHGPRKLLLFDVRVEIQLGLGDVAAARRTLGDEIAYAQALPEEQRSASRVAALQHRLATLPSAP